jgi:predicted dehydrogenase
MSVIKWGLIGAGDIARKRIAPALRDLVNCELVSVSRSRADLAGEFAREFGATNWFADWRELIADPTIDAVYIATPVFLHAEQTIAAANAGKHVLCEKPMALNPKECDEMIAACRAAGVKLGIAYYRQFYPAVIRAKQIIASGELGTVSVAQINAFEYLDMKPGDPRHWFLEKAKSGGGPMMDFGCHRLEIFANLFGKVRRIESLVSSDNFDREVEDTATALMQFENGTNATVTVTHASIEPQDTLHIFGTKGAIHLNSLNSGEMTIRSERGERTESHPPSPNFHEPLIVDFGEAVLQDREPAVSGENGLEIALMIEEIYKKGG